MFMEGGPSQIDLFDPKPELQKWHGKPLPPELPWARGCSTASAASRRICRDSSC
jgi:hypothetical protein